MTAHHVRRALDAYWLLDLAIEEHDQERTEHAMTALDEALADLADAAGLTPADAANRPMLTID